MMYFEVDGVLLPSLVSAEMRERPFDVSDPREEVSLREPGVYGRYQSPELER
jgi:hypothetical protein